MLAMLAARLPGVVKHRPLSSAFRALMSLPFQTSDPSPAFPHNHGLSRLKKHLGVSRKLMGSSWSLSKKSHQTKGPISLSHVGSASLVGRRRTNEDRFRISQMTDDIVYLAVFDGHGGREALDFCEANMEENIKDLVRNTQNLDVVLSEAFLEVDKALAEHSRLCQSGTTATVALLRDNSELVVASVGDSRALLCRGGKCLQLSEDHTAERKDERRRIQSSGGFIVWSRCAGSYVNGQLAMTRSIGDFKLKEFGVIAEPEVKRIVLNHEDSFLALTTDGIHGVMKNQEICSIISQSLDPHQAAQRVCRQALGQGSEDNVTIIVLPLGCWRQEVTTD